MVATWIKEVLQKRYHKILLNVNHYPLHVHDLIIHEMLRKKARQHNTTERQSNTTQLTHGSLFSKKKTASGGIQTHNCPLARRTLLPTELPRQACISSTNQRKASFVDGTHCLLGTKQPISLLHFQQSLSQASGLLHPAPHGTGTNTKLIQR